MKRAPLTVDAGRTVAEAAAAMSAGGVGSLVVLELGTPCGIVTESDLARRVLAKGLDPSLPVSAVMTPEPLGIDGDRPVFDALMAMIRHRIGHLLVWRDGVLAGVISQRDWLLVQEAHPAVLIEAIGEAEDVSALATARQRALAGVARGFAGAERPAWLGELIAEINDRVTTRAIEIALEAQEAVAGPAPVPFAWIAMGSEGRREQAPATDQDNGILYESPGEGAGPPDEIVRKWLNGFAQRVVGHLDRCGFPRCKGNVMATNPELCQPLEGWRKMFTGLIADPDPAALLHAAIYFDFRAVWGDTRLEEQLRAWLLSRAAANRGFIKRMAGGAVATGPPVRAWGWRLRRWLAPVLGRGAGTIDLKRDGLLPLVHGVRVWALAEGISATGTAARLAGLIDRGALPGQQGKAVCGALEHLSGLRLQRQFLQLAAGEPPVNVVALGELDGLQRRFLVDSLRVVCEFQDTLATELGAIAPD